MMREPPRSRALARRLNYRFMDVTSLMCSTYKTMSASEDAVSMQQLVTKEPLDDGTEVVAKDDFMDRLKRELAPPPLTA